MPYIAIAALPTVACNKNKFDNNIYHKTVLDRQTGIHIFVLI